MLLVRSTTGSEHPRTSRAGGASWQLSSWPFSKGPAFRKRMRLRTMAMSPQSCAIAQEQSRSRAIHVLAPGAKRPARRRDPKRRQAAAKRPADPARRARSLGAPASGAVFCFVARAGPRGNASAPRADGLEAEAGARPRAWRAAFARPVFWVATAAGTPVAILVPWTAATAPAPATGALEAPGTTLAPRRTEGG